MSTHTNNIVLVTSSGAPVRASHIIAANWGKSPTSLRIVMEGGEVITDHWATVDDAGAFLNRTRYAMRGIVQSSDPSAQQ